jgi:hypothetical protein
MGFWLKAGRTTSSGKLATVDHWCEVEPKAGFTSSKGKGGPISSECKTAECASSARARQGACRVSTGFVEASSVQVKGKRSGSQCWVVAAWVTV